MPEFHGRFSSPIAEICAGINEGDFSNAYASFPLQMKKDGGL